MSDGSTGPDFLCAEFKLRANQLSQSPLIVVHHIRRDTAKLMAALVAAEVQVIALLGPDYSVEDGALEMCQANGVETIPLPFSKITGKVESILESSNLAVGIIDTGGYASELANLSKVAFRIEMTNRGLWKYRENNAAGVLEIADTRNKMIESIFVAKAIVREVIEEAKKYGLTELRVGVIGFGAIGSNVAHFFQRAGYRVRVCETEPHRTIRAIALGFSTCDNNSLVNSSNVVVGCTGRDTFDGLYFAPQSKTLFFSGSSRDIEFRSLRGNDNVVVANQGLPINFRHKSLPMPIAEHLFLNLMFAIIEANESCNITIRSLSDESQRMANIIWLDQRRFLDLPDGAL